jgi:hypothetical protein
MKEKRCKIIFCIKRVKKVIWNWRPLRVHRRQSLENIFKNKTRLIVSSHLVYHPTATLLLPGSFRGLCFLSSRSRMDKHCERCLSKYMYVEMVVDDGEMSNTPDGEFVEILKCSMLVNKCRQVRSDYREMWECRRTEMNYWRLNFLVEIIHSKYLTFRVCFIKQ